MPRPKIRRGWSELTLHPRRDHVRVHDRATAADLVDAYLERFSTTSLLTVVNSGIGDGSALREQMISGLLRGDLFITHDDVLRPLQHAVPQWLDPQDDPAEPITPLREPTWVGILVVHQSGARYPGASLNVALPDGQIRTVTLDGASRARIEDVADHGVCRVRPSGGPLMLPDGPPDRPPEITLEPSDVRMDAGSDASVVVRTGSETRIVVVEPVVTRATCVRLYGALFALDKTFLLPPALEGIRLLKHMYETMPDAEILVVGHTDTTGSAARNKSLSLQRADAVAAYCRDDVEAWYACYGSNMDHSRRWGPAEDLAMLSALPFGGTPYYGEHHEEHSLPAAVRRFQEANGLVPDSDPGPITRRAMIAGYMAADGTSLPASTPIVTHGCGQWFPIVPTDDDIDEPKNRRVEIFFFTDGIDPRPARSISAQTASEYAAWREKVEEERTFRPSDAGLGTLTVATDLPSEMARATTPSFRLSSTDGVVDATLTPADGRIMGGAIELHFTALPRGSFYTFTVIEVDGTETVLFEDVPYPELSGESTRLDTDVIDPFATEV